MTPIFRIVLIFISICIPCSLSWGNSLIKNSVCNTFHVTHSLARKVAVSNVSVALKRAGDDGPCIVECIEPNTLYHVEFRNMAESGHDISGILLKQTGSGKILVDGYLPVNTIDGVCGSHSISHNCRLDQRNTYCSLGDDGKCLNITYMSASKKSIHSVSFRYTIVLSKKNEHSRYIENETITFPVCQIAPPCFRDTNLPPCSRDTNLHVPPCSHDTNLAGETVKYCPNFDLKTGASESEKSCGKIRTVKSNETHIFTSSKTNINYTCHTNTPVKKTDCHPTCTRDGQELCCKNKISIMRPRNFTCTAVPELNTGEIANITITRIANVLQTKQCVCYLCADIVCDGCSKKTNSS